MSGKSVMVLTRIWSRRSPTVMELFLRARRLRDQGRFEEAAILVTEGLRLDPDNAVGHLLAGSLHAALREMDMARAAFERVLALEPTHPRALLGLARIALEKGDAGYCKDLLTRALARYPDFPEARALLDVVQSPVASAPATRPAQPADGISADRLHVPAETHEVLVARVDGTPIVAQPRGLRTPELTARVAQLCKIASAMLARCGLGPLQHAVIDGGGETTLLRADGEIVLSIAFSRDMRPATALTHLDRVWGNCRTELANRVA